MKKSLADLVKGVCFLTAAGVAGMGGSYLGLEAAEVWDALNAKIGHVPPGMQSAVIYGIISVGFVGQLVATKWFLDGLDYALAAMPVRDSTEYKKKE